MLQSKDSEWQLCFPFVRIWYTFVNCFQTTNSSLKSNFQNTKQLPARQAALRDDFPVKLQWNSSVQFDRHVFRATRPLFLLPRIRMADEIQQWQDFLLLIPVLFYKKFEV